MYCLYDLEFVNKLTQALKNIFFLLPFIITYYYPLNRRNTHLKRLPRRFIPISSSPFSKRSVFYTCLTSYIAIPFDQNKNFMMMKYLYLNLNTRKIGNAKTDEPTGPLKQLLRIIFFESNYLLLIVVYGAPIINPLLIIYFSQYICRIVHK